MSRTKVISGEVLCRDNENDRPRSLSLHPRQIGTRTNMSKMWIRGGGDRGYNGAMKVFVTSSVTGTTSGTCRNRPRTTRVTGGWFVAAKRSLTGTGSIVRKNSPQVFRMVAE